MTFKKLVKKRNKFLALFSVSIIFTLFLSVSFTFVSLSSAAGSRFSDCLITNANKNDENLSKPLQKERLGNKTEVVVAILPFYFANSKGPSSSSVNMATYRTSTLMVKQLSNEIVSIQLQSLPVTRTRAVSGDFNVGQEGRRAVITQIIKDASNDLQDKNIDLLVLENVSTGVETVSVGEFWGLHLNETAIQTGKTLITNVVVLSENFYPEHNAHEFLHAFGLVDLYPTESDLTKYSMMALANKGGGARLLNYEKAVLGWFPTENIQCTTIQEIESQVLDRSVINFENILEDQLYIIDKGQGTATILEVQSGNLLIYDIDNRQRPPITLFNRSAEDISSSLMSLTFERNVSEVFSPTNPLSESENFEVLILDKVKNRVSLVFASHSRLQSMEYKSLKEQAKSNLASLLQAKAKSLQKTTITCIKGKVTKKIKAVSPKCPKGYKKK